MEYAAIFTSIPTIDNDLLFDVTFRIPLLREYGDPIRIGREPNSVAIYREHEAAAARRFPEITSAWMAALAPDPLGAVLITAWTNHVKTTNLIVHHTAAELAQMTGAKTLIFNFQTFNITQPVAIDWPAIIRGLAS